MEYQGFKIHDFWQERFALKEPIGLEPTDSVTLWYSSSALDLLVTAWILRWRKKTFRKDHHNK